MKATTVPSDTLFVLFGAGGDLSWRLVVPALFNLFLDGHLPERFLLLAADRADTSDGFIAEHYLKGTAEYSRRGEPSKDDWQSFSSKIQHITLDVADTEGFKKLSEVLDAHEADWGRKAERVFYLATPPSLFERIARGLGAAGPAQDRERVRLVVEKPLENNLESFHEINGALCRIFEERQLFRIDHFLGKKTVQNILAMRFANPIFEPIWNRCYVDHVTITAAETLGVEKRGGYKEAFRIDIPAAYETLLWDVMAGDATLFMRTDQVEAAWQLLMPIIDVWAENPAADFPNYAAGTWGPESADLLVASDGNIWLTPTLVKG